MTTAQPLSIKPAMLAKAWEPTADPTGWWLSEKLDGVRAIWDGLNFYSRSGKLFHAPEWFKAGLPHLPLDGELFIGRGKFNDTVSVVRSHRGDWSAVKFLVFDLQTSGPFEDRIGSLCKHDLPPHVQIVDQTLCRSAAHLAEFETAILHLGGEGVMLRAEGSPYSPHRTSDLRKLKRFIDDEATVTGHEAGEGKHEQRLGALVCRLRDGTEFRVGTGLSDDQRETPPAIGATITVRYFELTPAGVPRFPVFLTVRDYE